MMHELRVWAPRPERVEALIGERRVRMRQDGGGWWTCPAGATGHGSDYAFILDGGTPRPDPRSAFQPQGVHGPSRVVDHTSFNWHDSGWRGVPLPGSVLYECHIGTFSAEGTFDGAIKRLQHVADLGADIIELLPVAEFSGERGWGYDGVDLFAPHHSYGGPEGLKRFVDAAHAQGIGVVMDVVYNHLGPEGNYLAEFGPYFSRYQTAWGSEMVNFDGPDSDEVRRFVLDNALMWLRDYHCDGLRLDAVHTIADQSATHILEALAVEVNALAAHVGRPLFLTAESDLNAPRMVRSIDAGGYGLDASWAGEWHHALHATLTRGATGDDDEDYGRLPLLAKALRQAWVYDGTYSPYLKRVHGRPPTGLRGSQFVVFTQNHDQVGNRPLGERSAALMSDGRLRVAAALLLTSPFVPMIFQGEEWGATSPFQYFTDHQDPALGRNVGEGRRRDLSALGWKGEVPDPQDPAVFERSRLDWTQPGTGRHAGLLAWHRELIELRRKIPALTDPRLDRVETQCDEDARWLTVRRGPVTVAANLGARPWSFAADRSAILLARSPLKVKRSGKGLVVLPPDGVAILGPEGD